MNNLVVRILTSLILLPVLIVAFMKGGWSLITLLGLASLLSCWEAASIIAAQSRIARVIAVIFFFVVFFSAIMGAQITWIVSALSLGFFISHVIVLFTEAITPTDFEKISAILFWCGYINLGLLCLYWLSEPPAGLEPRTGLSFAILACLLTWGNDSFAYFGGRAFGSKPLFARVSSKKTWEGFFSGAIVSVLLVVVIKYAGVLIGMDMLVGLTYIDIACCAMPAIVLAPRR